ncbi:MAG: response regulator transcription factor [Campylobacterales bacterium]|nr:response regulator transcription factor [Campylobacterales bacterium]
MNIFLQEPDVSLHTAIIERMNMYRQKLEFKCVETEEEIFKEEFLDAYALFILNLKEPTNPRILNFIRANGGIAPVLLILDADFDPDTLKALYYLSYDDFIVKDFYTQEMTWKIYKLCNVWNDERFFLAQDVYFDCKKWMFHYHDQAISLGKKEATLLKNLFLKSPHVMTCDEIISLVYNDEIVSPESIRALVKQLRAKLPIDLIGTVRGEGYQITHLSTFKANP